MIRIGISTHIEGNRSREENAVNMDYIRALIACGALPILVPVTLNFGLLDAYVNLIDGLVLSGGTDIHPKHYGESNNGQSVQISDERDQMELYLLKACIAKRIPVFGICRGMQLINIHFGGALFQDLMTQFHTEIDHINSEGEADLIAHSVKVSPTSRLNLWLKTDTISVNSRHHQAIKRLGKPLITSARAGDTLVEAIEHPSLPILGVQWHPEDLIATDNSPATHAIALFSAFKEECERFKAKG